MPVARWSVAPLPRCSPTPAHPYTRCLQLSAPTMSGSRRSLFALAGPDAGPCGIGRHARLSLRTTLSNCGRGLPDGRSARPDSRPITRRGMPAFQQSGWDRGAKPRDHAANQRLGDALLRLDLPGSASAPRSSVPESRRNWAVRDVTFEVRSGRVRWPRGRERQRQEHVGATGHGTGARLDRTHRTAAVATSPARLRRTATPPALGTDGVSGSAIGAESTSPRRRYRHAGAAGRMGSRWIVGDAWNARASCWPRSGLARTCWTDIPRSCRAASVSASTSPARSVPYRAC